MNTSAKDSKEKHPEKGSKTAEKTPAEGKASPVNLATLSDDELAQLVAAAQTELEERRARKRAELVSFVLEQARALDFDPEDVAAALVGRRGGSRVGNRAIVKPKYWNPANASETWSGRGVKPKWMEALLAKGAKLEDFSIAP